PVAPPASRPAVSPDVERVLDRVEAAGRKIRRLTAEVRYTEEELLFAERTTYTGRVWYAQDPDDQVPPRFRIRFDAIRSGGHRRRTDRDYVFYNDANGQWLISRNGDIKQIVKYHVAPAGSETDPLELGQGPFPVPFGQRKDRVLSLFEVTTRPTTEGDPDGTTFLKLVPRDAATDAFRVRWIEIWVNDAGLPVKIRTEDTHGETRKTAVFRALKINPAFEGSVFELPWPSAGSGWERRIEPLPEQSPGGRTGL
ncbi:MAG: LolA family protein, partial [Planctomycetota bacterium]